MAGSIPHCEVVPLADEQVSLRIGGRERLRWHYSARYPRPFFFPFIGPAGSELTRMGHPGAPDHEHHRSIFFGHHAVLGIGFWNDNTEARIRQKQWLSYRDGDDEAVMAVSTGWYDGHDPRELLEQTLVASVRPAAEGETLVELQSTFKPTSDSLEFGKTNFGFLAVRVAKGLSAHFGGGRLTSSEGLVGEPSIFGTRARWMDYSGSVEQRMPRPAGEAAPRTSVDNGITYFDHPSNPGHPTHWHVRDDGWMGASVCMHGALNVTRQQPLVLRYLLHAHEGLLDAERADEQFASFADSPAYEVVEATAKHQHFEVRRTGKDA